MAGREFYLMIEKDEDGFYVGEVPQLRAGYTLGKSLDELVVTVPVHPGQNLRRGILRKILRDPELTPEEFLGILRG